MKKIALLLAILMLGIFVCACGSDSKKESPKDEPSVEEKVATKVEGRLKVYILNSYDVTGLPNFSSKVKQAEGNTYTVTGKVSVNSDGNKYVGNYDAVVTYDPTTGECSIVEYDLGDLYKTNG